MPQRSMTVRVAERGSQLARVDRHRVLIKQVVDDQVATGRQCDHGRLGHADPLELVMGAQERIELGACGRVDVAGHEQPGQAGALL